jgi:hypothetical protein
MTYIEYLRKLEGKPNDTVCETTEAGPGINQRDDEALSNQRPYGEDVALRQAIDQLNAYFDGDTVGSNRYYASPSSRMSGSQLSGRYSSGEQQEAVPATTPDSQPTASAEEYIPFASRPHPDLLPHTGRRALLPHTGRRTGYMFDSDVWGRPTISVDTATEEPRSGEESAPFTGYPRINPYG